MKRVLRFAGRLALAAVFLWNTGNATEIVRWAAGFDGFRAASVVCMFSVFAVANFWGFLFNAVWAVGHLLPGGPTAAPNPARRHGPNCRCHTFRGWDHL